MLISVIVPVYNNVNYLSSCIESIEKQDFRDYEIIMVDDGSSDGSSQLCDSLANKYDNINVFHQTNRGVSAARNLAISKAVGEYLVFVDSDDTLRQGYFSKIYECHNNSNVIKFGSKIYKNGLQLVDFLSILKNDDFSTAVWGYVIKLSFLKEAKVSFDTHLTIGEDKAFLFYTLIKSPSVLICSDQFYIYTYRRDSAIHKDFTLDIVKSKLDSFVSFLKYSRQTANEIGAQKVVEDWVVRELCYYYKAIGHIPRKNLKMKYIRKDFDDFLKEAKIQQNSFWIMCRRFVVFMVISSFIYIKLIKPIRIFLLSQEAKAKRLNFR